jgi:hypothetical protein
MMSEFNATLSVPPRLGAFAAAEAVVGAAAAGFEVLAGAAGGVVALGVEAAGPHAASRPVNDAAPPRTISWRRNCLRP